MSEDRINVADDEREQTPSQAEDAGKRRESDDNRGRKEETGGNAGDADQEKKPSFIRRHPFGLVLAIIAIIALIIIGYIVWLIYFHPYESTDDAFVDARSFSVAAKVSGYVAEVPVTDNQHIKAGDVILKIDPRDYQIALDQAQGQAQAAQASIENADAQIAVAGASVEQARAQQNSATAALQYAQDEADRQQQLVKSGAGSLQTTQQAVSTLHQDQANLAQTQASVTSALKNEAAVKTQKSSAIASLTQAQAQVEEAQQNLKYTTIVAAQPGRVVRLTGAKGQYLDAGQAIAMFVPDDVWITANFKETQLTDMRPGQLVNLTIDAYPDHKLTGKIDSIQPGSGTAFSLLPAENATGNYVKVTQRVPVKIVVDHWPSDVAIGPGMSVVPTVTVRPRN
ncbi:HlyD family secretion protein [Neorhizobium sp. P12A]|uniref:HlyD family secretion protein n=1 Tax=Rhizobium/Agrobacterium group TaxID=227290 RepID=UPI0010433C6D|nr:MULTISPECIES: HlyD family secretion protein [Rhizobium/Agrobacterium group]KAA0695547.1 HlyD family secretion protein [Neorhizobium sp. P12A]TCR79102.1 membrane fusion protein (multidrug efflux system) [Rhizobium sp. BK376]